MKLRWDEIREKVDIAVRAGLTKDEFCDENDIHRSVWYRIKPKGFKWRMIQLEKGIKVKTNRKKGKKPGPKPKAFAPTDKQTEFLEQVGKRFDTFAPAPLNCTRYGCDGKHDNLGLCNKCKVELLESLMLIYRCGFGDDDIRGILG